MTRPTVIALALVLTAPMAWAGTMPWAKDEAAAKKAATEGNKLIMIDFHADW